MNYDMPQNKSVKKTNLHMMSPPLFLRPLRGTKNLGRKSLRPSFLLCLKHLDMNNNDRANTCHKKTLTSMMPTTNTWT